MMFDLGFKAPQSNDEEEVFTYDAPCSRSHGEARDEHSGRAESIPRVLRFGFGVSSFCHSLSSQVYNSKPQRVLMFQKN